MYIEYKDLNGNYFIEKIEVKEHWTDYYIRDYFFNLKNRLIEYTSIRLRKDLK